MRQLINQTIQWMQRIPEDVTLILARLGLAVVFFQSGQTKVEGWRVTDSAIALFKEEYKLPLLDPTLAAHMAAVAEHVLPALLIIGLATRFAALGILAMTAVIQIFVYPDAYGIHSHWAACALILITRGGGTFALDRVLK